MSFALANVETIYAEDPELKHDDVKALFEWLTKQPHLPKLTELQVILFLHSCHYSMEATKTTIDNYFTIRTGSDLFKFGNEEVIRRALSVCYSQPLPKTTPDGCFVFLIKLLDPKPEVYVNLEHLKVAIMGLTLYFHQSGPVNGLILLGDVKNLALGHLTRLNLSVVKQALTYVQEAAPTRIEAIHLVNINPLTESLVTLVRPFLKKDIFERIKFHPHSIESLYEHVPKECLPQEYGGELPPLQSLHEKHIQHVVDHLDFFKWHDTQEIDASRRAEKSKGTLGNDVQGSFKKLQID